MWTLSITRLTVLILCFGILFKVFADTPGPVFAQIDIRVKDVDLKVEYADTFERRNRGLMHRRSMCEQCGMLFNFGKPRQAAMWMKNTYIPLDVAFITEEGSILDILAMQPHDLTSIKSSGAVKYALEMNQGWFAAKGIKVGDKLTFR